MHSEFRTIARNLMLCGCICLLSSCTRTVLDASIADTLGGTEITSELDFWDELALQDAVSNRDAIHALLLTFELLPDQRSDDEGDVDEADGEPMSPFDAELNIARNRSWIDAGTDLIANETAQVGWIARAICIEAKIEGGVNMRLFGPIPRYALRELHYERLLSSKSENQAVSGLELLATIGRVQDRRTGLVSMPRLDF